MKQRDFLDMSISSQLPVEQRGGEEHQGEIVTPSQVVADEMEYEEELPMVGVFLMSVEVVSF